MRSLIDCLARSDERLLRRAIAGLPLANSVDSTALFADRSSIARCLSGYLGDDLLAALSVRVCLLAQCDLVRLNECAASLGLPDSQHVYDAALTLGCADWGNLKMRQSIAAVMRDALELEIPKHYVASGRPESVPAVEEVTAEAPIALFDYQSEISDRIVECIATRSRAMVQMPTGSGKTRTASDALVRSMVATPSSIGGVIVWLAHTEELCEQAVQAVKRAWMTTGRGSIRVFRLWGTHGIEPGSLSRGFVVASLQRLYSLKQRESGLYKEIELKVAVLVFDEAHKALAPTYLSLVKDLAGKGNSKPVIGLTATPGRSSSNVQANEELARVFDGNLLQPSFEGRDPFSVLRERGILSKLRRVALANTSRYQLSPHERRVAERFLEIPPSVLARLGSDGKRNLLIVSALIDALGQGRAAIVFACSVAHCRVLAGMLEAQGVSAVTIDAEMSAAARARSIRNFKSGEVKVILNYGVLTTGFDAPHIGIVAIARPTSSVVLYSQMIGRGLRGPLVGGSEECLLLDVVDNIDGFGPEREVYSFFSEYWLPKGSADLAH